MSVKQKSVTLTQSWTKLHSTVLKKYRVVITSAPIGNIEYKIIKNAVTHKNVSLWLNSIFVEKRWTTPWGSVKARYNANLGPSYLEKYENFQYTVNTGKDA